MAGNISEAYRLVVAACNDPNIGYSQGDRYSIKLGVNYRTHCDCSSLMAWALFNSGFTPPNTWFATSSEEGVLTQYGWTVHDPKTTKWDKGDILWRSGHTEMVYESYGTSGITMGAHSDSRPYPEQVSINSRASSGSSWTKLFKSGGSATGEVITWIQCETNSQRYLNSNEMTNNAKLINAYFSSKGYTREAIAGMLANLQRESTINPNIWQSLTVGTGGYGLCQWTPAYKYRNWASGKGYSFDNADKNGYGQLEWIDTQMGVSGEWIKAPSKGYTYTWDEFKTLTSVREATLAWLYEFERAGVPAEQERLDNANKWYEDIAGFPSDIGNPPDLLSGGYPYIWGFLNNMRRRKLI